MNIHPNSRLSYREELPRLGEKQREVFDYLRRTGAELTEEELSEATGIPRHTLSPRCHELIELAMIREVGTAVSGTTGKTVRVLASCSEAQREAILRDRQQALALRRQHAQEEPEIEFWGIKAPGYAGLLFCKETKARQMLERVREHEHPDAELYTGTLRRVPVKRTLESVLRSCREVA